MIYYSRITTIATNKMCFRNSRFLQQRGYFVDANIIITYQRSLGGMEKGLGIRADLVKFIHNSEYKFFYTETVKNEVENDKYPDKISSKYFTFINSGVTDVKKAEAVDFFHKTWIRTFEGETKRKKDYIELTPKKLEDFRNDLLVIMEAGYSQYDLSPSLEIVGRSLLTNNMKLYRKFMMRKDTREILERSINLVGLEHLIEVELIDEVVEQWETKTN